MPGMYADGELDLAGFCVGVVERDAIIGGKQVQPGDQLLGLASSGPHSNGYSLIRRILDDGGHDPAARFESGSLGDALLEPTRIYVRSLLSLIGSEPVHALAHITGGGLPENLARVLPADCDALLRPGSWHRPAVFDWLQREGRIADDEMLRTFNCGIGMVAVVPAERADAAATLLEESGERVFRIGAIGAGSGCVQTQA
jgi:phosphoribosylformylglycinamidine cyclo-ligase